jgi:eukaryotic-like serine/threonine-protein kinase
MTVDPANRPSGAAGHDHTLRLGRMQETKPPLLLAGRYAIEEEAGSGGMASVWRATDEVLSRPVAVKVPHAHLAADPAFIERFAVEARASARLTHPNIAHVLDTGVEDGVPYIVMEYFAGETLEELLAREGPLEPDRVVEIALQLLSALRAAHDAGVIHRDVKPANVLIGDGDRVKVTDFGLAKAVYLSSSDPTTTGSVLGSVPYVSPEQLTGADVDARSDLYAVGVVIYEMLTGRRPFRAETHLATAMMRLSADPPTPRAIRPGIPRELDTAVMEAMERRPVDRFASAEEMADALHRLRRSPGARLRVDRRGPRELGTITTEPTSFFRSWMLVPLLVLALGAVAIGVGLLIGRLEFGGPIGIQPAEARAETIPGADRQVAIPFSSVVDFDPFGTEGEHPDEVPLASDDDPSTIWTSETYSTTDFAGLKDGVGLLFDLGGPRQVTGFRLETPSTGYSFEIRVGDDPSSLAETPGAPFVSRASMRETLNRALTGRYVLFWITSLVDTGEGNQATVAEFKVFGPRG